MTFPNAHLYLTLHWVMGGLPAEIGQCGMRFDTTAPATQGLVDACAGPVQTFWALANAAIHADYRLSYLRLASIAPDGKYVVGTVAYDHVYPGTIPGGGIATQLQPLQIASVATFNTAVPRGQAHRGRVYLPPIADTLQTGYVYQTASANNRANSLAAMCTSLNTALGGKLTIFSKGTKAAPTVGAKNLVTSVKIGTKPDVQRRRANREVEVYGSNWNIT